MNLFSSKLESFGLDISDFSLRLAMFKKQGGVIRLSSFAEGKIPADVFTGGQIKKEKALADIIKKTLTKVKGEKITTKYVVASLPEEKSFLDIIQVPQVGDKDLENTVKFEASNHIPVPLEEVSFGFKKIASEQPKTAKDLQEVLIAATNRDIVVSYTKVLRLSGLVPLALEIEGLAVVRALVKRDSSLQKPILIIDLGGSRTSFLIFSGQSLRFTSTIPVSSRGLTEVLSQKLKISVSDAEKLKVNEGLTGNKKNFQIMTPLLLNLVSQIRTHLGYYRSHVAKSKLANKGTIDKILLCGSGANLKGLAVFLADQLKIEVEPGNPWVNVLKEPLKEKPEIDFEKSLCFTTAIGLALKDVLQ